MKSKSRQEGIFATIAAMVVLFSAMLEPIVSVIISAALLIFFAVWKFAGK